jgi:mRNA-degrading endonuclease toxin of MazEF toxin-antitoxin module
VRDGNLVYLINVSQLLTVDRARLGRPQGAVPRARLREVLEGLALLLGTEPETGADLTRA